MTRDFLTKFTATIAAFGLVAMAAHSAAAQNDYGG